jgi:hypothetical protein
VGQRHQRGVGDGGDGRLPRSRVEQRQLAEHLARAEHGQQVLAAVGGGPAELDLALDNDEQPVTGVAFVEQHLAATQPALRHGGGQRFGCLLVELAE